MFALLAPILLILARFKKDILSKKLLFLFGIYFVVLAFGTILGNLFPYAMLFPFMIALAARTFSKNIPLAVSGEIQEK
jgi:hypothetical protein